MCFDLMMHGEGKCNTFRTDRCLGLRIAINIGSVLHRHVPNHSALKHGPTTRPRNRDAVNAVQVCYTPLYHMKRCTLPGSCGHAKPRYRNRYAVIALIAHSQAVSSQSL